MTTKRLTRRQKRQHSVELNTIVNKKLTMKNIQPMTKNQELLFNNYKNGNHIANIGSAGTGKTYVSLYLALDDLMTSNNYEKIIIVRSAVQSRDQGFMPGSLTEKMAYYEAPYVDIVNNLFERADAYSTLKQQGMITFMSTSFIRGLTFDNAIIIVDEAQNMSYGENRTIMTRVGNNSKIIFCGDTRQDDLKTSKNRLDTSGLGDMIKVLSEMKDFSIIKFTTDDIVRSELIKDFIITEERVLDYA